MNCFLYIIENDVRKCEKEEDIPREAIRKLKVQNGEVFSNENGEWKKLFMPDAQISDNKDCLPESPIDVASMLINATVTNELPTEKIPPSPLLEQKHGKFQNTTFCSWKRLRNTFFSTVKLKERGTKMPIVKITNPNPHDWRGTKCFIDGKEVHRVRSVNFHTAVDEIPVFEFEIVAVPDIEMECLAQISVTSQSITDAILVLRHELLQHGEIYNGFKSSLKSALESYNYCGMPFEPEEEIAEKILDFLIGEEKENECT